MKHAAHNIVVTGLAGVLFACAPAKPVDDPRLVQSRELVQTFASRLQGELESALAEGGPAHAVRVCKDRAPLIASELSRLSGAKVGRTSLRYRNPVNAPEPWQLEVLRRFEERAKQDPPAPKPEFFAKRPDGSARYLSAIFAGYVCLACHGTSISAALEKTLELEYPDDLAVGYGVGDIRGAFSVTWPATDIQIRR